ncbi:MAG: hypothetical protein R2827_03910 [Bdellovibrionales bacterium]
METFSLQATVLLHNENLQVRAGVDLNGRYNSDNSNLAKILVDLNFEELRWDAYNAVGSARIQATDNFSAIQGQMELVPQDLPGYELEKIDILYESNPTHLLSAD